MVRLLEEDGLGFSSIAPASLQGGARFGDTIQIRTTVEASTPIALLSGSVLNAAILETLVEAEIDLAMVDKSQRLVVAPVCSSTSRFGPDGQEHDTVNARRAHHPPSLWKKLNEPHPYDVLPSPLVLSASPVLRTLRTSRPRRPTARRTSRRASSLTRSRSTSPRAAPPRPASRATAPARATTPTLRTWTSTTPRVEPRSTSTPPRTRTRRSSSTPPTARGTATTTRTASTPSSCSSPRRRPYNIYVGTYDEGSTPPAQLHITEIDPR